MYILDVETELATIAKYLINKNMYFRSWCTLLALAVFGTVIIPPRLIYYAQATDLLEWIGKPPNGIRGRPPDYMYR